MRSLDKNENPLVSVITVVFNKVQGIECTLESVLNQDFHSYEHIVIDGKSTDGTVDVIERYTSNLSFYTSEKDSGIYDAMNKGIKASNGKWLLFMNAGDTFYSNQVLTDVFESGHFKDKVLVYGYKYDDTKVVYPHPIDYLRKGIMMANHQSMFFNTFLLGKEMYYSLKYPIYGDFELVNRIYLKWGEDSFEYIDKPIAIYEGGGISERVSVQKRKDKYKIMLRSYGLIHVITSFIYSIVLRFKKNKQHK